MTEPSASRVLVLRELAEGIGGISPSYGASLAEAAAFCLEWNQHASGVRMTLAGARFLKADRIAIEWQPLGATAQSTWNDTQFATEQGAYGIAILLIVELTGWSVVERSRKGTGFDFWLSSGQQPFAARLEVSGILRGDRQQATQRSREKLRQIERSNISLPGYVAVVELSEPYSLLVERHSDKLDA